MPPQNRSSAPTVRGARAFLDELRDPGRNLKEKYRDDPLALAERFGIKLPKKPLQVMDELGLYDPEKHGPLEPGIRDLVEDVCTLAVRSAVACASRGGGKSFGASFIEFFLWMILDFDALNLGGSELQADAVYQYMLNYLDDDPYWKTLIRGEPQREKTFTNEDSWVRVLAASQKSVRSPHAGGLRKGKVRGGILVIDEEAEADPGIVEAALPTINTAKPSVSLRVSTFHNIGGSFQDVVDNHVEMGYKLYRWDIFDVCEGCDCTGDTCESPEPCFREDHYEDYIDPEDGELKQRLIHRAYCNGRAKYAQGWIPMEEIETLWRRMKRSHYRWEIEAMGNRPSSKDFVIRDITKFTDSITKKSGESLYMHGKPVTICVDWGTGAAGIEVWQEQSFDKHVLIEAELMKDNNQTQVFGKIIGLARKYGADFTEIAADIGGGGNYLNDSLRNDYRLPVRDVNFGEEKESAVAVWNALNEGDKTVIPSEFTDFIEQVKSWKRKAGRIAKGNDHMCDAAICYFSKFVDRMGVPRIGVPPKSFNTAGAGPSTTTVRTGLQQSTPASGRVPVAVSLKRQTRRRPR